MTSILAAGAILAVRYAMSGGASASRNPTIPDVEPDKTDLEAGPRGAARHLSAAGHLTRRSGELVASTRKVVNDPYVQSVGEVDPELEAEALRITRSDISVGRK